MATKEKHNVEKALKMFIEMGQNEVNKNYCLKFKMKHISKKFVMTSEYHWKITFKRFRIFFSE